jgi:hypothetical protein
MQLFPGIEGLGLDRLLEQLQESPPPRPRTAAARK